LPSWAGTHSSAPFSGELLNATQEPLLVATSSAPENTVDAKQKREKEYNTEQEVEHKEAEVDEDELVHVPGSFGQ
jgi:hypothetical protein